MMKIYDQLLVARQQGKKKFAILIDPDKCQPQHLNAVISQARESAVDYFLIGGSLVMKEMLGEIIGQIKRETDIPVILFPGDNYQLDPLADGILLLSLISGRNPDLLIGRHIISAPWLKSSNLEILPTGYMLIESGPVTTAAYMSQTMPIPSAKSDIAACTAMAGELLGMKLIYLDGGSGAAHPVSSPMIRRVRESIDIPLIVGGGITGPDEATRAFSAGADLVVVGNAIEHDPGLIRKIAACR